MAGITVQDIEDARQAAILEADRKIAEAFRRRDAARTKADEDALDALIESLEQNKVDLDGAAGEAQNASIELAEALRALKTATDQMNRVEEQSAKLSRFISLVSGFSDAALGLVNAIRGAPEPAAADGATAQPG